MNKKCFGCNKYNISIFDWLAGNNLCSECKKNISSESVSENYERNSKEYSEWLRGRIEKNNNMFGIKTSEQKTAVRPVTPQEAVSTISHTPDGDTLKLIGGIAVGLFFLWTIFGGLLEDQDTYKPQNTVNIDCRQPDWQNSPYCNSEYDSQAWEQDFNESNFYQNTVR